MELNATLVLWIAFGGALGSVLRAVITAQTNGEFPYGTLAVNVLGSMVLGALFVPGMVSVMSETVRIALAVGLMGGFTTMSAFSAESVELLRGPSPLHGLTYIGATLLLCVGAVILGAAIASRLLADAAPH